MKKLEIPENSIGGVKQRFVNTLNLFYFFYRIERMKRQAGEK